MHIFVFIKYFPSTNIRSTNTRFYALPGFVRHTVLSNQWTTMLVDTMMTAYYYKLPVTSRHVGWSYQLHVMIGSHDLTLNIVLRMVFALSAMILHIQYIYEDTRSSWRRSCPSFRNVGLVVMACLEYELSNLITLLVYSTPS